jgi:perosamine synthetase
MERGDRIRPGRPAAARGLVAGSLAGRVPDLAVYPPHRLDVSLRDLLLGLAWCLRAPRRPRLDAEIARVFPPGEDALVALSVRSGFDLLLEALAEPPGGEVLVSAVTHPDMVRIIEKRGLRAVPVDLDTTTLEVRREDLERTLTTRTRMVLVAHLFGGRFDLGAVAAFARKHRLTLVEDCAQAFRGPHDPGDPLADVSMFSFGTLKTASAVGGAVLRVREPDLLEKMRRLQQCWPLQSRRRYAGRLLQTLCLVLLGRPLPYGLLSRVCGVLGRDLDALVNSAVRASPEGRNLAGWIRHQPCAPLLALLAWRLRTFDEARLRRRAAAGEHIARHLPPSVGHPGGLAPSRTHWLFPVVPSDPEGLVSCLSRRGFDASRATSNIAAVPAPPGSPRLAPQRANRMMDRIVFVPAYPELRDGPLERLISALEEAGGEAERRG